MRNVEYIDVGDMRLGWVDGIGIGAALMISPWPGDSGAFAGSSTVSRFKLTHRQRRTHLILSLLPAPVTRAYSARLFNLRACSVTCILHALSSILFSACYTSWAAKAKYVSDACGYSQEKRREAKKRGRWSYRTSIHIHIHSSRESVYAIERER